MNIFVVDRDPSRAAQALCDKHVVKMLLESAQLLCGVHSYYGEKVPYKATHINHPCSIWARSAYVNYLWLLQHAIALCEEYTYRYGKIHKSSSIIQALSDPPEGLPSGRTDFVLCMPENFKGPDPVQSYRDYYHSKTFAAWNKNRKPPEWWRGVGNK